MRNRSGLFRRSVVGLAVLPLATVGLVFTAPAASAAGWETTSNTCDTSKNGKHLKVKVKVFHNDHGDVEQVLVRATDRNETGSFEKRGVNLKLLEIEYRDDADAVVFEDGDSDSPWEVGDDGTDIESVTVRATWKVKGEFKTKTCTVDDLD